MIFPCGIGHYNNFPAFSYITFVKIIIENICRDDCCENMGEIINGYKTL